MAGKLMPALIGAIVVVQGIGLFTGHIEPVNLQCWLLIVLVSAGAYVAHLRQLHKLGHGDIHHEEDGD